MPARIGQSLVAGTPIAEILDPNDVFVDWYIPNERFADPEVGREVVVLFGNRRICRNDHRDPAGFRCLRRDAGVVRARAHRHADRAHSLQSEREPPALNSTVYVHMYYTDLPPASLGICVTSLRASTG